MSLRIGALLALCWSAAVPAGDAPFTWQLRAEGSSTTHHLVGSIHMLPPSAHPLPAGLERAYAGSARLILESDPQALNSPALQARLLAAGRAESERGLRAEVPAALYTRLRGQLAQMALPDALCDALRAWLCALTLELGSYQRAGFLPALGIDQHFHDRARADGKPVAWLEAPLQQLALFTELPGDLGAGFLASALDGVENPELSPERLLRAWREGDVTHLHAQVEQLRRDHPRAYARLLADRNAAWLAPLTQWLRDATPTLVVVGAAHLVGADSVLDALRDRGFEVSAGAAP